MQGILNAPQADIKDGNCLFTTVRQQLLDKPKKNKKSSGYSKKDQTQGNLPVYCVWKEPFVLHYDDPLATRDNTSPLKQRQQMREISQENNLKFTVQLSVDEVTWSAKGKGVKKVIVGQTQSFQVDQFQDGELYLKEIKFGTSHL